jgi:transcriptional regulator with XRE-family HTH domain
MIFHSRESELRELCRKRRLTLEAVGYLAGVDTATVSRLERGLVEPRRETVVRVANAYGVSVRRLAAALERSPEDDEPAHKPARVTTSAGAGGGDDCAA